MHGIDLAEFPNVAHWHMEFKKRPAVQRGLEAGSDLWGNPPLDDDEQRRRFAWLRT
jgi:hypothetical protein